MDRCVVAVEGLVHAGKTTLINTLSNVEGLFCVGEYIDFADGRFPDFPQNKEDACNARKYFLDLECKRRKALVGKSGLIVLDRSVLSILAYHFAVEMMTDGEISCFSDSIKAIFGEHWIFPEVCVYLDIDDLEIERRHKAETAVYNSILLDSRFNLQLRRFYEEVVFLVFPLLKVIRLNACNSQEHVFSKVNDLLMKRG